MDSTEGPTLSALVKNACRSAGETNAVSGPTTKKTDAYRSATTRSRLAASATTSGGSEVRRPAL